MTSSELNTKFDQFLATWLGKRTDFDGAPKGIEYQCVDVPKRFWNTYWGTPNVPMGKALNYAKGTLPAQLSSFLKRIFTSSVKKGDAVILYTNGHNGDLNTGDGHIGLATGKTTQYLVEILEQNGAKATGQGTGGDAIRTRFIEKERIACVLRPEVSNATTPPVPAPPVSKMPPIGAKIRVTINRTVYKPGTTTAYSKQLPPDIRTVRGYDPKYPYRILVNSASVGNGVALALYYTNGTRIEGWQQI